MGQTVSIDTNPPKFADLSSISKSTKTNYTSNIKVWVINGTSFEPVKFTSLKTFSDKDCYIILHLFRKGNIPLVNENQKPIQNKEKNSLYELIHSSLETLTPRGMNYSFSINEFIKEELFTLYLWNGKKSSSLSQSTAVTKALQLEKLLDSTERIFDCGEPENITKFYKDDFYEASTLYSPEAFENMCRLNSLARFFQNKNSHQSSLPSLGLLLKEHIKIKKNIEGKENKLSSSPSLGGGIKRFSGSFSFQSKERRKYSEDNISTSFKSPLLSPQPKSRRFSFTDDSLPSPHRKVIEKNPSLLLNKKLPPTSSDSNGSRETEKSPRPNPSWGAAEMVVYYRKICSEIRPNFYLGSDYIARSKDILKKNNITHIVNAARVACDNYFPDDFAYLSLNLYDSPSQNIIGLFYPVIDFIDTALEKKQGVYVHCYQGVSRSSAIVIAYIMWKEKKAFRVVNDDVKEKRQVTAPNAGFTVQLLRWEKIIFQKTKETYMYRLSPLNDRYQEHKQTGPQLCDVPKLDTRTCFILHTFEGKVFVWVGKKSNEQIEKDAETFMKLLQKMIPGLSQEYVKIKEGEETSEFNDSLSKIVTPDAIKKLINMNNPYPELDDFDKEPPKNVVPSYKIEPIIEVKVKVEEDGKLFLFEGRTFENLSTFDSDDLDDSDIFVLFSQKDKVIYVWVGPDVDDVNSKFVAEEFIKYMNLPTDIEVHETTRDEEPEEFWKYFVNG